MVTVGIIPSRYASTRFPGKPLADINGKPMIQRVYEQASKALKYVCVATDDSRIYSSVESFGGNVVYTDKNHVSGTDRCAEAIGIFEKKENIIADTVINIQGDEPFISPMQIEQISKLFLKKSTQIATLVKPITEKQTIENPNKVKVVIAKNGNALYFSRSSIPYIRKDAEQSENADHIFYQHIGMYAYRKNVLLDICHLDKSSLEIAESLEQLRWIENGYTIKTATTQHEGVSIDTPDDLKNLLKALK